MLTRIKGFIKDNIALTLVLVFIFSGLVYANLSYHTEALLDTLLLNLDSNHNGDFTDETWYTGKQNVNANLTSLANINFSANILTLLGAANYAAVRADLDLEAGTDFIPMSVSTNQYRYDLGSLGAIRLGTSINYWEFTQDADGNVIFRGIDSTSNGKTYINTGPFTIINGAIHAQTDTTSGHDFSLGAAYDTNTSTYDSLIRLYAGNPDYMEVGPASNNLKVDNTGAFTLQGNGNIALTGAAQMTFYHAANPTLSAAGQIGIDTSTGAGSMLRIYTDAQKAIPTVFTKEWTKLVADSSSDYALWKVPYNITIVAVHYLQIGGTNWVGQFQEGDSAGANGVDTQSADSTVTSTTDVTSFSNATLDLGDWLLLKTTSVSGTNTYITVQIDYTVDPVN